MHKPGVWAAIAASFAVLLMTNTAVAQSYPWKPIRLVIPVTPGGGVDAVARLVGQKLTAAFNQQVVVDNRPGAGGTVASDIVAKAVPDGHTLAIVTASHVTNASLYKRLPYDPVRDFTPITLLSVQPYLLVVNASTPVRNVKEFVAFAKAKPGGIAYASAGTGLLGHLSMEFFRSQAGFEGVHVPYKGGAPALVDVMGGRVDAFFSTITSALPHVRSGRVRALAVSSAKRHVQLPDVPTIAESGFPGFDVLSWYALLAPAGTPRPVVLRLHGETVQILGTNEVKERMAADGAEPLSSTPQELAAYLKSEMARWAKVIRQSGATAE
jgi:tripartite-type tricarboxylate transporter receptor subunit TctC